MIRFTLPVRYDTVQGMGQHQVTWEMQCSCAWWNSEVTCSLTLLSLFSFLSIWLYNKLERRIEVGLCVYQLINLIYPHVNIWKEHLHSYSVSGTVYKRTRGIHQLRWEVPQLTFFKRLLIQSITWWNTFFAFSLQKSFWLWGEKLKQLVN